MFYFISINSSYINRRKKENSRTCEIFNVNVHGASYAKHLRSKKHLKNILKNEMTIPEWLSKQEQTPIKKQIKKLHNPRTIKQIARESNKMNDKEVNKHSA